MPYRQRRDHDVWHLCGNCTNWPVEEYDEQSDEPSGRMCFQCLSKQRNGVCRSEVSWLSADRFANLLAK
jgi:hypothetical protein